MERVGDWLEYRIARGQAGLEAEGPYREAVIEAKVARLKAESDREIALLEAHNKLRQAGIQAAADKKTAQGKGDAAAMKSGSGSGGSRGGSGGGRGGSGGGPAGGGRNASGSGGGRGGAGAGADKGGRKDSRSSAAHSPSAGRAGDKARVQADRQAAAAKANEDKRRQERQRAREQSPAGSGRGGAGGGRGSGGATPRQERTAARQSARADRRAERGKARDQRRAAEQSAGLSDRTKDRDQARAERQRARDKAWADREARQEQEKKDRAERDAARAARREKRKARREEKKAAGAGRTTLGKAIGDEAQRRFDKRRKTAEAAKDGKTAEEKTKAEPGTGKPADGTGDVKKDEPDSKETGETTDGKTAEPGTGKSAEEPEKDGAEKAAEPGTAKAPDEPEKESGSADGETGKLAGPEESATAAKGPESPSEPPAGTSAGTEPEEAEIVEEKPSGGSEAAGEGTPPPSSGKRSFGERIKDRFIKNKLPEEGARAPLWMEAEGERARPPIRPKVEDDIVEAHIIEPDGAESHEAGGAETPVSAPEIAQVYNRVCRFCKEPWVWETYIPSGKKVPKSPSKEPSDSGEMDEESVEPWDLYYPVPPRTGSGKPAAKAETATPGPGTPAAEAATPVKVGEPTEKDRPHAPGETSVNKTDPLAHLTDAQIVGFLVPGHSRPPEPSTPIWDDTATPAASGPGAEIPAQSAPPDTTPKEAPPMSTIPASSGSQLAAKHQTDITFDQYLVEMTNIALAALGDKETAEDLVGRLLATAKALLEIAEDLADDHNVDKRIVAQISELSEALQRMTDQATRCAQECADAAEAAVHAAAGVARVYGQDMDAKREAGLVHASAAAHHN
ncbi:hypothetical protein ACPCSP_30600 [Streptomyces cinereoruber]|uniref:hypothetical protein n=1 Tax=Streptomyces cinereoruber TaxID=67260 RepID=UPI003C2E12C6